MDADGLSIPFFPFHRRSGHGVFLHFALATRRIAPKASRACAVAWAVVVRSRDVLEWFSQPLSTGFVAGVRRFAADRNLLCDHGSLGSVGGLARMDRHYRDLPGWLLDIDAFCPRARIRCPHA